MTSRFPGRVRCRGPLLGVLLVALVVLIAFEGSRLGSRALPATDLRAITRLGPPARGGALTGPPAVVAAQTARTSRPDGDTSEPADEEAGSAAKARDEALLAAVVLRASTDAVAAWTWYEELTARGAGATPLVAEEIARRVWVPFATEHPAEVLTLLAGEPRRGIPERVWQLAARTALRRWVEQGAQVEDAVGWANAHIRDSREWEETALDVIGTGLRVAPERSARLLPFVADDEWRKILRL